MKKNSIVIIGGLVLMMFFLLIFRGISCETGLFEVSRTRRILDAVREENANKIASLITIDNYMGEVYYNKLFKGDIEKTYIKNLDNFFKTNDFEIIEIYNIYDRTDDCFKKTEAEVLVRINDKEIMLVFWFGRGSKNRVIPGHVRLLKDEAVGYENRKIIEEFNQLFTTYYPG